jgi:predicted RNA-binding protein with RPS1 domain
MYEATNVTLGALVDAPEHANALLDEEQVVSVNITTMDCCDSDDFSIKDGRSGESRRQRRKESGTKEAFSYDFWTSQRTENLRPIRSHEGKALRTFVYFGN